MRSGLALALILATPMVVFAGMADRTPAAVKTSRGARVFLLDNPHAARSAATLDAAERVDKHGRNLGPIHGYEVLNRVVVQLPDPSVITLPKGVRATSGFRPLKGIPGYYVITSDSVADALLLAEALADNPNVREAYVDISAPKVLRAPTDPHYTNQWHLNNTLLPIADVNAEPAWDLGYTGSGVIVGIVEGGWQYDHPDLAGNFSVDATQPGGYTTSHATSCAGVVGAVANNGLGGVGLAYGAEISGQIYGSTTQTASAFEYRNDLNDIKSNSWGPSDNGEVTYLSSVERAALENSVATGRDGLGEIFVWAAGNGGLGDRVEYDPYASSRMTIAIGSIGDGDYRAYYNETGSSMLAVTHSSGNTRGVYTTTAGSGYTSSFGGTSSASPLAAGTVALMLEANPNLTWRDVQHVLIETARKCDPNEVDWTVNGAGRDVNYNYGFGAIDALSAIAAAETWVTVGAEVSADTGVITVDQVLPDADPNGISQTVEIADNIRIESVELILNVTTPYVGDLRITLTSPDGTESILAVERADAQDDYVDYIFTSLRCWDEESSGTWQVNIADYGASDTATWQDFRIKVYGTEIIIEPVLGDANCDGVVSNGDIDPFVLAITDADAYAASYPDCDISLTDCNGDGVTNNGDIDAFLELFPKD